jgi:hypothetical protein
MSVLSALEALSFGTVHKIEGEEFSEIGKLPNDYLLVVKRYKPFPKEVYVIPLNPTNDEDEAE